MFPKYCYILAPLWFIIIVRYVWFTFFSSCVLFHSLWFAPRALLLEYTTSLHYNLPLLIIWLHRLNSNPITFSYYAPQSVPRGEIGIIVNCKTRAFNKIKQTCLFDILLAFDWLDIWVAWFSVYCTHSIFPSFHSKQIAYTTMTNKYIYW